MRPAFVFLMALGLAAAVGLGGCATVAVGPACAGGMDQTRAFAHADPPVWYDYCVQNGRLVYLAIDALPPEQQTPALMDLVDRSGAQLLKPAADVDASAAAQQAREGLLLMRYGDGRIVAGRVDPVVAGQYVLAHRFKIAEVSAEEITPPMGRPVDQLQIHPAASNDDAHGLNLLGTLCGCPAFLGDAQFRLLARSLAPAAEAMALADQDEP